jgi:2-polyprenyl-3-methyl-5-hydroxy-6-metoxy-1,4-benzoquinol methylase
MRDGRLLRPPGTALRPYLPRLGRQHGAAGVGERWGADVRTILDVACGIGTQSIGLATKGFAVTASDLSAGAVDRAHVEARRRGVAIDFSVCDMRVAHDHHGREFDVVIACDNAIPHLLSDDEILRAFRQMRDRTRQEAAAS